MTQRYSIHDRATVHALLSQQLSSTPILIPGAIAAADKRYARVFVGTSKYQPHQGTRECARRIRHAMRDRAVVA